MSSVPEQAAARSPLGVGVGDALGPGLTAGVGLGLAAGLALGAGDGLAAGEGLTSAEDGLGLPGDAVGEAEAAALGLDVGTGSGLDSPPPPVRAMKPANISRTTKTAARTIVIPIHRAALSVEGDWRVMSRASLGSMP
jgi:hypothetical protein